MEGLFFILIIIWVVVSALSRSKKATQKQQGNAAQKGAANPGGAGQPRKPAPQQATFDVFPKAKKARQQSAMSQEGRGAAGSLGSYKPMESREGLSDYKPLEHRLNTSGRTYDYTGSLGGMSTEGVDTCDPSLEHGIQGDLAIASVYEGAIGGDPLVRFDRRALLQGVVMSEVLTRPALRKRGRR